TLISALMDSPSNNGPVNSDARSTCATSERATPAHPSIDLDRAGKTAFALVSLSAKYRFFPARPRASSPPASSFETGGQGRSAFSLRHSAPRPLGGVSGPTALRTLDPGRHPNTLPFSKV